MSIKGIFIIVLLEMFACADLVVSKYLAKLASLTYNGYTNIIYLIMANIIFGVLLGMVVLQDAKNSFRVFFVLFLLNLIIFVISYTYAHQIPNFILILMGFNLVNLVKCFVKKEY